MSSEYSDSFVRGLEWMWGEGFLSPGGPAEVAQILKGVPVAGKKALDIGCAIGGVDVALVNHHEVGHVTGIDIDPGLVERGRQRVQRHNLQQCIELLAVEPGKLPFPDASFDLVFSKDSLIHIPDKSYIYAEMFRVLKAGGWIAIGDWLGSPHPASEQMEHWLALVGLRFSLDTLEHTVKVAQDVGFVVVDAVDRNAWYAKEMERELATLTGDRFEQLVNVLGQEAARQRVTSSTAKFDVVRAGELRPSHIRAYKPGTFSQESPGLV